jgi:hypothetical protein
MEQGWRRTSRRIYIFYGKGNENHELGRGFFVHIVAYRSFIRKRPRNKQRDNSCCYAATQLTDVSTTIKLLLETMLCNPLLGSRSSWTATLA